MNVYLAEIVGTFILILLGNGAVANVVLNKSKANGGGWIVITTGWGLAVAFAVYAVGRISGAHINPAVTVALASVNNFSWSLVPGYIAAQTFGAFLGAVTVYLTFLAHYEATTDKAAILATFSTGPAIRRRVPNFITEVVGTAMLVFGVLAIGAVAKGIEPINLQESLQIGFGTWFGPMLVGILVLSIGLSLGGPTGYAINPARDLGPRIAHAILPIPTKGTSDWSYSWIPIIAPLVGGVLGAQLFVLLGL